MVQYSDFTYYKNGFGGTLIEEQDKFDKLAIRASAYVRSMINGKLEMEGYSISDYPEVKYVVCAMVEAIELTENQSGATVDGAKVSSVSNDGYSVSYVNEVASGVSPETVSEKKMKKLARMYLSETGLLSRCVY